MHAESYTTLTGIPWDCLLLLTVNEYNFRSIAQNYKGSLIKLVSFSVFSGDKGLRIYF